MKLLIIFLCLFASVANAQNFLFEPVYIGSVEIDTSDSVGVLMFYPPVDVAYGRVWQQDGFDVFITEASDTFEVKSLNIEICPVLNGEAFGSYINVVSPDGTNADAVTFTEGMSEWFKVIDIPRTRRFQLRITAESPYSAGTEGKFLIYIGWH